MGLGRRRNSVSGMLVRLAAALALVLGLNVLIGLWSVNAIQAELTYFRENVTPAVDSSSQLQTALTVAQSDFRGYLLTGDLDMRVDYAAQHTQVRRLNRELGAYPDVFDPEELQSLEEQTEEWFDLTSGMLQRPGAVRPPDVAATSSAYEAIVAEYDRVRADLLDVRDARRADYLRAIDTGQVAIVLAGLLAAAAVLLSTRQVATRIAGPLRALGAVVRRHQRGDVEVRARTDQGPRRCVRWPRRSTVWRPPRSWRVTACGRTWRWRG